MAIKFLNRYSKRTEKEREQFNAPLDYEEDKTDQSQLCSASMVEMAKKFGIDALISKAEQMNATEYVQNELYGHDFTKMYNSKEEMLNIRKKLNNIFENVPARMRKELFNDDVTNLIEAYTSNDETKLKGLNEIGLVSDTQLMAAKDYNTRRKAEIKENQTRQAFIEKMNTIQGGLYEQFKETGNININNDKNNSGSDTNV